MSERKVTLLSGGTLGMVLPERGLTLKRPDLPRGLIVAALFNAMHLIGLGHRHMR
jgi:hypothetical protein